MIDKLLTQISYPPIHVSCEMIESSLPVLVVYGLFRIWTIIAMNYI
jgi:hypothetical protein